MSSTLLLMRHGAAASPAGLNDRERPLTNRGRGRALRTGDALKVAGMIPDRVLVSPAVRAQETWEAVELGLAVGSGSDGPGSAAVAVTDSRIFDNTVEHLLDVLREVPEGADRTVLLIGHNPGVSGLASVLDEDPENPVREDLGGGYPPATVTVFEVDDPWPQLREGRARLVKVMGGR